MHLHVAGLLDRCTYTLYTWLVACGDTDKSHLLSSLLVTLSLFPLIILTQTHTSKNILNYRVKAYIRNGWVNNIQHYRSRFTCNNLLLEAATKLDYANNESSTANLDK